MIAPLRALPLALALAGPVVAMAQSPSSDVEALPISFALGVENVELPGGEPMGLASRHAPMAPTGTVPRINTVRSSRVAPRKR